MKKVKFLKNKVYASQHLTIGGIYDVIRHIPSDEDLGFERIFIKRDDGFIIDYYVYDNEYNMIFQDISEYRNDIIDGILE